MPDAALIDKLACPRCDTPLAERGNGLHCRGCRTDYPLLDGLPFLFADPGVALDEWRQRYHARIRDLEHRLAALDQALQRSGLLEASITRLNHEHAALTAHREELQELLAGLQTTVLAADHSTYLALRTRLPGDQGLVTYYANLHRDWCWGDDENAASAQLVASAIGDGGPGDLLVLGAGGGRLAYDLHQNYSHASTVALDFNPLLVLAAARLARGKPLALHEFPLAPASAEDVAIPRQLTAPAASRDGLHWALGNALRAPFKPGSFDTVLTPWLIDVLDEPLGQQAARWNQLLRKGGRWIWFGSHVFRNADPAARLSLEESMAVIEQQGFSEPELVEAELPYMASPANRHTRRERVIVMSMTKTGKAKAPPRHVALPDWLVRTDQAVPARESFKTQGAASRIHGFLFAMIDGKRSLDDMAALMEQERLMPKDEAIGTLRNFLIRALEESEGYSTF